jgi:ABC-type amino acid transport substrate-binding protein
VGVDASSPVALHSDPSAATFEGFEVDLMTDLAARLGLIYRYRSGLWAGLIDELREGKLDAIVTAATITESRKHLVDFSQPYFDYTLAIATRRASAIRTLADLEGQAARRPGFDDGRGVRAWDGTDGRDPRVSLEQ